MYEPTIELCDGLPVYQKKGNSDMWIEYFKCNWLDPARETRDNYNSIILNHIWTLLIHIANKEPRRHMLAVLVPQ